jgi:hypothetical protein
VSAPISIGLAGGGGRQYYQIDASVKPAVFRDQAGRPRRSFNRLSFQRSTDQNSLGKFGSQLDLKGVAIRLRRCWVGHSGNVARGQK